MFANIERTRIACSFSAALFVLNTVKLNSTGVWLQWDCDTFAISQVWAWVCHSSRAGSGSLAEPGQEFGAGLAELWLYWLQVAVPAPWAWLRPAFQSSMLRPVGS